MRNALLFLASLLISLLLAEGVLHVVHPFDRMQTWIELSDRGYVMNRAGGTAIHELDGQAVEYTFDSTRFRIFAPASSVERQASSIRHPASTILLGDSYAFGLHLPDSSTLAHRMGWRNFAVGGAGPADYLAQMRDFLPTWPNVDTVVVLLSIDDATRTLARDLFRLNGESQRWRNSAFRGAMEALPGYHPLQKHSYLLNGFVRFAWPRWYFDELTTPDILVDSLHVARLHTQIFAEMRDLCVQNGCELVLASNGFWGFQTVDRNQDWLMQSMPKIAVEIGVRYVDCDLARDGDVILTPSEADVILTPSEADVILTPSEADVILTPSEADVILRAEGPKDLSEYALPTDPHPSAEGVKAMASCLAL